MDSYPGGKGNCYRQIINLMPPHDVYIETHLGGGSVFKNKRPARSNIGIDIDAAVIGYWRRQEQRAGTNFINGDASCWLGEYPFTGRELVYCDPPYVMETRKGGELYNHEYTDEQHRELLATLLKLPCYVMISGYRSSLYMEVLQGWHYVEFPNMTRRGVVTESLWMNFTPNGVLHDYQYVGANFRERERIKRKRDRWVSRLMAMAPGERQAIANAIDEISEADRPASLKVASGDGIENRQK